MNEIIFSVEDAPEGGYLARAVGHSISTEADTLPELRDAVRDAVRCQLDDDERPKLIRLHFVREEDRGMRLPRDISGRDLAKALGKLGYQITRQTGTHPAHDPGTGCSSR